jgi:uncharacterized protein YjiS (DUF1127 family)
VAPIKEVAMAVVRVVANPSLSRPATFASLLAAVRRFHEKTCQRCDLAELDDRLLRDIGLTRKQARDESRKPFWR